LMKSLFLGAKRKSHQFWGRGLSGGSLRGGTADGAFASVARSTSTARRNSSFEGSNVSALSKSMFAASDRPIFA
jgi:hypothetical protein